MNFADNVDLKKAAPLLSTCGAHAYADVILAPSAGESEAQSDDDDNGLSPAVIGVIVAGIVIVSTSIVGFCALKRRGDRRAKHLAAVAQSAATVSSMASVNSMANVNSVASVASTGSVVM